MNRYFGFLCALACCTTVMSASTAARASETGQVIGYFDLGTGLQGVKKVQWANLTELHVAFIGIDADSHCAWLQQSGSGLPETDLDPKAIIEALRAARDAANPGTKIVLSVGGWTQSYRFGQAVRDNKRLMALASSCTEVVSDLSLDGLDVDWEYPGKIGANNCPAGLSCASRTDKDGFGVLLIMLRSLLPAKAVLSAAVYLDPAGPGTGYPVAMADPFLDHWNVMAYDAAAPTWHPAVGFHAGIDASTAAIDAFVSAGASRQKVVLGIPFYAYVWQGVASGAVGSQATGKQSDGQYATLDLLSRYANDPGCLLTSSDQGDYYYCSKGANQGDWAALDTVRVIVAKANYVRDHQYGGVMCWSIGQDRDGSLLNAMVEGLAEPYAAAARAPRGPKSSR